eukprot:SAG31_NODE_5529_length_2475_cov_2.029040_1_plen_154_part_00
MRAARGAAPATLWGGAACAAEALLLVVRVLSAAAPSASLEISLEGHGWELRRLDAPSSAAAGGAPRETGRLWPPLVLPNATVPGGVWDNLHRAAIVGEPLYRENDLLYANATTRGPDVLGWAFTKVFDCPAPSWLRSWRCWSSAACRPWRQSC